MILVVAAICALVLLIVAFKVMRMVASGCLRLVVLAILAGFAMAAWYYLRHRLVL